MEFVAGFINLAFELVIILVIIYVLLGYISPGSDNPVRNIIAGIVEPLLNPIRRMLPKGAAMDFSPVVLILVIILIQYLVGALFRSF